MMFQSKRKIIEQLEAQLRERDRKIIRLEDVISKHEMKFEAMRNMLNSTPNDCKIGGYCKGCSFSKAYRMYNGRRDEVEVVYLCNKAGYCENFVRKE